MNRKYRLCYLALIILLFISIGIIGVTMHSEEPLAEDVVLAELSESDLESGFCAGGEVSEG